jgi:hypothetical protein
VRPISEKNPTQKRVGEMAQSVGFEFKPQYCKKKKEEEVGESKRVSGTS